MMAWLRRLLRVKPVQHDTTPDVEKREHERAVREVEARVRRMELIADIQARRPLDEP